MNAFTRGALTLLATCATGAGILAATAGPAAAARVPSQLALTVAAQDGTDVSMALLTCQPAGGAHPRAAAACATVASVNGRIASLDVDPNGACTREYQPVTASAVGIWEGRPVRYTETFSNRCEMLRETGPLFDF
ncbi:SSI family serine proteinase inhibitor [Actinoplanes sp. NPDC051859]|uniref:SSI family serine proteinase inhibitor n=1 Tax=Actinoplanes sp. NPDC051859 TaxID=3363909 RepID=UPI0037978D6F